MPVARSTRIAVTLGACAALALTGATAATAAGPTPSGTASPSTPLVSIYPGVHVAHTAGLAHAPGPKYCLRKYGIHCYGARQIQKAYHLPRLYARGVKGQGQTIAIVDAYGSPTIRRDLRRFDAGYKLPAPPSLKIVQPAGKVAPYKPTSNRIGWAYETTLDVEYAHTIAPKANIVLVETPVSENEGRSGFPAIVKAEKYVINHHLGGVISQSFSATEQSFPTAQALTQLRSAYQLARRKHVTVLAASGDSGAADVHYDGSTYYLHPVTSWPDSDPLVTAIGGTQLHLNAAGRHTSPDNVWNDTYDKQLMKVFTGSPQPSPFAGGGGRSVIFQRPSWQDRYKHLLKGHRGVPDISMSGACNGAVNVYLSLPGVSKGWHFTCGTSEATPLFSGIVALTNQVAGHDVGFINPSLYAMSQHHAPGIVDIRKGNTTVTFTQGGKQHTVHGAHARPGYDLASGVGTVDAPKFVPELARYAG